ncbi:MAG: N-acetylmuramoyl-L-alanine amidase [Thermodesulfobacteriota bacterium]
MRGLRQQQAAPRRQDFRRVAVLPRVRPGLLCLCLLLAAGLFALFDAGDGRAADGSARLEKRFRLALAFGHNLEMRRDVTVQDLERSIAAFATVGDRAEGQLAARALFAGCRQHQALYQLTGRGEDLSHTRRCYDMVVSRHGESSLADDALFLLGELALARENDTRLASRNFAKILVLYPEGDMAAAARERIQRIKEDRMAGQRPAARSDGPPRVADIRYGTTAYYSRVTIETTAPVSFQENILPKTADGRQRLYLDLAGSRLENRLAATIPVNDGLLQQIRSAQHSPDTVRVVFDTTSFSDYRITTENEPFRIFVDVWGEGKGKEQLQREVCKLVPQQQPSLVQQLGLQARRIILDPGHGGKDPGAINRQGMKEKDITLSVAQRVAAKLQAQGGYEVFLTRNCDEYLSLEARTEIANRKQADIFVSLHVNSADSPDLRGIETYYLSLATSPEEMRAASTENATAQGALSDLQAILSDLMMNSKINESARLAESIQDNMVTGLGRQYPGITNLGVKKAPFIVLIGAQMPAVLIEIAFMSNPVEAQRLRDIAYLDTTADKIVRGISGYSSTLTAANAGTPRAAAVIR